MKCATCHRTLYALDPAAKTASRVSTPLASPCVAWGFTSSASTTLVICHPCNRTPARRQRFLRLIDEARAEADVHPQLANPA